MFEQVVANLLNNVLGDYLDNLETHQLNIGIWAGDVALKNLRIRTDAFDQLDLPISVLHGQVGNLVLKIPWQNLKGQPVRITLSNVVCTVAPREGANISTEDELERLLRRKLELLEQAELMQSAASSAAPAGAAGADDQKQAGYLSQLTTKIIDNLQIAITNIHVRYVDKVSNPLRPLHIGLTLRELSAISVNADWKESFSSAQQDESRKLLNLKSLAVYWVDGDASSSDSDSEAGVAKQLAKIPDEVVGSANSYLLKPISGAGKLTINRKYGHNVPKYDLGLEFNDFSLALAEQQYRDLWVVFDQLEQYQKTIKYRHLRPPANDRSPRTLWKFATDAILLDVRAKLQPWTKEYITQRRRDRLDYIRLYKMKKTATPGADVADEDRDRMLELQRKYDLHDLLLFNKMANIELRDDARRAQELRKKQQEEAMQKKRDPSPSRQQAASGGWGSWLWSMAGGSGASSSAQSTASTDDAATLAAGDLDRFLDYDDDLTQHEAALPLDCMLYCVKFHLATACLFLQKHASGVPEFDPKHPIVPGTLTSMFQNTNLQLASRLDSTLAVFLSVEHAQTFDGLSSCHREIITSSGRDPSRPLFALQYTAKDTSNLQIDAQALTVLYTPDTIDALSQFFTLPDSAVDAYMQVASSIKHQTRAGLEYALDQHHATNIALNIDAPIFLLPLAADEVMALDMGQLTFTSKLVDTDKKHEVESKEGEQLSEADLEELLALMYDKYDVAFKSMKLLIGPSMEAALRMLGDQEPCAGLIVDNLDLNLVLEMSILPKATNLSKMKLSGALPYLKFNLSDHKYKAIMKAMELVLGPSAPPPAAAPAADVVPVPGSTTDEGTTAVVPVPPNTDTPTDAAGIVDTTTLTEFWAQNLIDFQFHVDHVSVKVQLMDLGSKTERDLAVLDLHRFDLDFKQRSLDRVANIRLQSLAVRDLQQPDPNLTNLITSMEGAQDLVRIAYHQYEKSAPQWVGYDQDVTISFDAVALLVTPQSIVDIYDFLMTTFVGGGDAAAAAAAPAQQSQPQRDRAGSKSALAPAAPAAPASAAPAEAAVSLMRVTLDMRRIVVRLNEGGDVFAEASLGQSDLQVILGGPVMHVAGTLGIVEVHSATERILYIDGERSATFSFDMGSKPGDLDPIFDSVVDFKSEATRLLYRPTIIFRILNFLSEFATMRFMADVARQRAVETANAAKLGFKVASKSPVVEYRMSDGRQLLIYLGELNASNTYASPEAVETRIAASLSDVMIVTQMPTLGGEPEQRHILDRVQVALVMQGTQFQVDLSDVDVHVTQVQYRFLLEVYQDLFGGPPAEPAAPGSATGSSAATLPVPSKEEVIEMTPQDPVGTVVAVGGAETTVPAVYMEVSVNWRHFSVELLGSRSSLTKFDLHGLFFKTILYTDSTNRGEFGLSRFSIRDTRPNSDVYKDIIALPPALEQPFAHQLMCKFQSTKSGMDVHAVLDSPQILLIFNFIQQLQLYFALEEEEELSDDGDSMGEVVHERPNVTAATGAAVSPTTPTAATPRTTQPHSQAQQSQQPAAATKDAAAAAAEWQLRVRLNVVNAQVALVHHAAKVDSNALVLGFQQLQVLYGKDLAVDLKGLGVFLCRMDNRAEQIRVLQDVDVALNPVVDLDRPHLKENVLLTVARVLVRLSYQEALFIQAITQQYIDSFFASAELEASDDGLDMYLTRSPSRASLSSTRSAASQQPSVQIRRHSQLLKVKIESVRVILIDDLKDVHVPMVDLSLGATDVQLEDWSTEADLKTALNLHLNLWNPKNSHWEPVLEPSLVHVNLKSGDKTKIEIRSEQLVNLNVSKHLLQTLTQTSANWPTTYNILNLKVQKPYLIRNCTGHTVSIWSDTGVGDERADIPSGEELAWRFDHWKAMRDATQQVRHRIAVHVHGTRPWETLTGINVDREQMQMFALRPDSNQGRHRLCVEIKVQDKIKVIVLKSPIVLLNTTLIPVEIKYGDRVVVLKPKDEFPIPLEDVFQARFLVRPDNEFSFNWSDTISWAHFRDTESMDVTCRGADGVSQFMFILSVDQQHPKSTMRKSYPMTTIRIGCPIELENLLPFDAQISLFDRQSQLVWRGEVEAGAIVPVGTLDGRRTLRLSVVVPQANVQARKVLTLPPMDESSDEEMSGELACQNDIFLNVQQTALCKSGASRRVTVSAPMVIHNTLPVDVTLKQRSSVAIPSQCVALFSESKPALAVPGSTWSTTLALNTFKDATGITVTTPGDGLMIWHVGIRIAEGGDRFGATKLVTFCPRFVIKNCTGRELQWRQAGTREITTCASGEEAPLTWMYRSLKKSLVFRYRDGTGLDWSAPVDVQQVGQSFARMDPPAAAAAAPINNTASFTVNSELLEVEIVLQDATLFVFVKQTSMWPFRVENLTDFDLEFMQAGLQKRRYQVPSGRSANYALDDPTMPDKALTLYLGNTEIGRSVNLFEIGTLQPWDFNMGGRRRVFALDLLVDGTTRVLQVTHFDPSKSIYRVRDRRGSDVSASSSTLGFDVIDARSIVNTTFTVDMPLGVSIVDETHELLYVTLRNLKFDYNDTNLYQTYGLLVHWLQIDNQLYNSNEPIVLYPTELAKDEQSHHTIHLALVKSKDRSHGIQYYKYFSLLLQELSLSVDQALITALTDFFTWQVEEQPVTWASKLTHSDPQPKDNAELMYFEAFQLQPVKLNVSFSANASRGGSGNVFAFVTKIVGMGLGNIHNMPIKFNALTLEHPIGSLPLLLDVMYTHYYDQLFGNMYKILGSADVLGNPVGLFNNLASGVQDIFYEPYQGIVSDRPQDLGIGLAKGTATFLGKTLFGVADGFSKITGAIGKGLAMATLDENFQQARQVSRARNRPRHAVYGVTTGTKSLVSGVFSGVTGVVMRPIEGAEKEGVGGFFKGVGKGLVGLASKPVVGLFDMASNLSEGIKNTTTVFDDTEIDRVRLPRYIGEDGVLRGFSDREALGQSWLKLLENGRFRDHHYVAHLETKKEDYVYILSTQSLFLIRLRKLKAEWDMLIEEIRSMDRTPTQHAFEGQVLYTINIYPLSSNLNLDVRTIDCIDRSSLVWFAQQVDVLLQNYHLASRGSA
ncbi:hypothetical protein GGF32_001943 [Allomyces javanicus]|nr:hypothetical protein GGF32_001943 [Allomyces javanicus]